MIGRLALWWLRLPLLQVLIQVAINGSPVILAMTLNGPLLHSLAAALTEGTGAIPGCAQVATRSAMTTDDADLAECEGIALILTLFSCSSLPGKLQAQPMLPGLIGQASAVTWVYLYLMPAQARDQTTHMPILIWWALCVTAFAVSLQLAHSDGRDQAIPFQAVHILNVRCLRPSLITGIPGP